MRASSARGVSRNSENAYFNHGLLSATLNLKPGTNTVKLAIVGDLPQIVKAPGDLRIHMLRVEEFRLRYLRPAAEDLPKGKTKR